MNEARFIELLAAYGAEMSRWPEDDRGDAEAFLEVAPHRIKDLWESERAFDHLLALEKDGPASISLETRVIGASPNLRRVGKPLKLDAKWPLPQWVAGGALAASLGLDELVVNTWAHQPAVRRRSYALLAEQFDLAGRGA